MTRRRIIEPGMVWALSRRTTRRHFILNPDEARQVEQAYWYCLGHAARLHGVLVHAGCLMSTHSHEVITDVRGELSLFLQTFHRQVAIPIQPPGPQSPYCPRNCAKFLYPGK